MKVEMTHSEAVILILALSFEEHNIEKRLLKCTTKEAADFVTVHLEERQRLRKRIEQEYERIET